MTVAAQVAFANLALSAKLHKLLDRLSGAHAEEQLFNTELESALSQLEREHPALREEARTTELELLKRDLESLEELYWAYREKERLPEDAATRFEKVFATLKEKIKEKGLT